MHKNGFSLKYVKNRFRTRKGISLSQFYNKVGKNKSSTFFQAVCEVAILRHVSFLYSWAHRKMATWAYHVNAFPAMEKDGKWEK